MDRPELITEEHHGAEHELEAVKQFVREHGPRIIIGILIVVVASAGVSFYRKRAHDKLAEATELLFNAQRNDDLQAVLDDYPSSPSAPLAMLKLARSRYDAGEYDTALALYDGLEAEHPDHPFAQAARVGRAHCMEGRNQIDEAITLFQAFETDNPGHFLTPQATLGRARCLETLGRIAEAKIVVEDFIAANADSGWLPIAEERLQRLNSKADTPAGE